MTLVIAMAASGAPSRSACQRQPVAGAPSPSSVLHCTMTKRRAQQHRCGAERQQELRLPSLPPTAGLLAAALLLAAPAPAVHAYNVRLEDVDSPTMQAGEVAGSPPVGCSRGS